MTGEWHSENMGHRFWGVHDARSSDSSTLEAAQAGHMNIAIYREVEVHFEHLPNDLARVELRLPGRAITFKCH